MFLGGSKTLLKNNFKKQFVKILHIRKFWFVFQNTDKIGSYFQNLKGDSQIIHIRNFCKKLYFALQLGTIECLKANHKFVIKSNTRNS